MPLKAPNLDNRTFEDLLEEARLRIPHYTPEWTDFNDSDPGMTLVQLFAWLTEMTLYKLNQVPDLNYVKFLDLLGLEPKAPIPAVAYLSFTPRPGANREPVPRFTRVTGQPEDGGDPVIFETEQELDLIAAPLTDVQVCDASGFTVVTEANTTDPINFRPLGWEPQVGNALYLGFEPPEPVDRKGPFPREMRIRAFLPLGRAPDRYHRCGDSDLRPEIPVKLVWEYKDLQVQPQDVQSEGPNEEDTRPWRRLITLEDNSAGFTRDGDIVLQGPPRAGTSIEGKISEARYWLRCRLASGAYPSGTVPELDFMRPNTVKALNLSTEENEILGPSEGTPNQYFQLAHRPVIPETLELWAAVNEPEGVVRRQWQRVDDFLSATADDLHFRLDSTTGRVFFGDGRHGRIPFVDDELGDVVALKYRYGGGKRGNLGAGLISTPGTQLVGVDGVVNERPAFGGNDEQTVDELRRQAPRQIRGGNRAVTVDDYEGLARQVNGVAKAKALAEWHPDFPGIDVPGAVTVVILPEVKRPDPEPSEPYPPPVPHPELLLAACRYLNRFRTITAEVYVQPPKFLPVRVKVRVMAQRYASAGGVEIEVKRKLIKVLDPPNREFGRNLFKSTLTDALLDLSEHVRAVLELEVEVAGQTEQPSRGFIVKQDELVYAKDLKVTVEPFRDED